MTTDDQRSHGEICALARARIEGIHGCLDASTDAPAPCLRCAWCSGPGTPIATMITASDDSR